MSQVQDRRSLSTTPASPAEAQATDKVDQDSDLQNEASETYTFRLFSAPAGHSNKGGSKHTPLESTSKSGEPIPSPIPTGTQQIRLNTPPITSHNDPSDNTCRTAQKRPLSYYLAAPLTPSKRIEYEVAAMSGDAVRLLAKRPCPGLRHPWRVVLLPPSSAPITSAVGAEESKERLNADTDGRRKPNPEDRARSTRTRLGKKARLKTRRKVQAVRAKEEARVARERLTEEAGRAKEARIKERNKLRNREKQLKRRERDREKRKAEAEQADEIIV